MDKKLCFLKRQFHKDEIIKEDDDEEEKRGGCSMHRGIAFEGSQWKRKSILLLSAIIGQQNNTFKNKTNAYIYICLVHMSSVCSSKRDIESDTLMMSLVEWKQSTPLLKL
uniref:Cytochrome P450 n=1 Tax=Heterorhabditis bacteriophora TaxID=37862 RepID=A0A1I7XET7_HETBA